MRVFSSARCSHSLPVLRCAACAELPPPCASVSASLLLLAVMTDTRVRERDRLFDYALFKSRHGVLVEFGAGLSGDPFSPSVDVAARDVGDVQFAHWLLSSRGVVDAAWVVVVGNRRAAEVVRTGVPHRPVCDVDGTGGVDKCRRDAEPSTGSRLARALTADAVRWSVFMDHGGDDILASLPPSEPVRLVVFVDTDAVAASVLGTGPARSRASACGASRPDAGRGAAAHADAALRWLCFPARNRLAQLAREELCADLTA